MAPISLLTAQIGSSVSLLVGGVECHCYYAQPNQFLTTIWEGDLETIDPSPVAAMLFNENLYEGGVVVGRVLFADGLASYEFWPIVVSERLGQLVQRCASTLTKLIHGPGVTNSFRDYLFTRFEHDPQHDSPESQPSIGYWWLVTDAEGPDFSIPVAIYQDSYLFIPQKDKLLRIYSSSMFASIASGGFSKELGCELRPEPIGCLGCFLTGSRNEIEREKVRGAILDDQWPITFTICDERTPMGPGGHYFLEDGSERYALVGCPDKGTVSVWVMSKWDRDGRFFNPSCNPLPW